MLRVFIQFPPEPTDGSFKLKDRQSGEWVTVRWHKARLVEVGYANTFAEAKKFHPHPITEEVTDPVH